MKEFGSDFHFIELGDNAKETIGHIHTEASYYASGRHALIDLYKKMRWKRLWVPVYFCYEVLGSLERAGVNVAFYEDYPLFNECETVKKLPFEKGDALFRVNYFGLRTKRSNNAIPVPVVEDHTHDLIGEWAINSDADWCIASLRKTLPLAEGGMLWSPKGYKIEKTLNTTACNERLASIRWNAMRQKTLYLDGKTADKTEYRTAMISTEEEFDSIEVSALDLETSDYIKRFDTQQWFERKLDNWTIFKDLRADFFTVLEPEGSGCYPFSLTLLFKDEARRNTFRKALIGHDVYPAILWRIPAGKQTVVTDFADRMLSIHCDARYSEEDMIQLRSIILEC